MDYSIIRWNKEIGFSGLDKGVHYTITVAYFNQDKKYLEKAKAILSQERYRDVYQAQEFLKMIEEVGNDK